MLKEQSKIVAIKKYVVFVVISMFMLFFLTAEAKTYSYESTYSMTGGVFSKSYYQPSSYIKTTIVPETGTEGCNMGIIWAKKCWYGWDGDIKYVSSTSGGSVKFNTSDKRKIWLRNYSGKKWTGKVVLNWD